MGKSLEWVGLKFGKLTCLKRSDLQNKGSPRYYDFLCECGTVKRIDGYSVRSGDVVSCGCHRAALRHSKEQAERISKGQRARALNLTGAKVGLLTYHSESHYQKRKDGDGSQRYINVQCACGTIKAVAYCSFVDGLIYSCGCVKDQLSTERIKAIHSDPNFQRNSRGYYERKA